MKKLTNKLNKIEIEMKEIDEIPIKDASYVFYGILLKEENQEGKIKEIVKQTLEKQGYAIKKNKYFKGLDEKEPLEVIEFSYGISMEELKRKTYAKHHNAMIKLLKLSFPGINLLNEPIKET